MYMSIFLLPYVWLSCRRPLYVEETDDVSNGGR